MKLFLSLIAGAALVLTAVSTQVLAADEVTVTGEGKCGKCSLKETASCQNVIQAKENDKTVTYYLAQNDVSKKFHENLCQGSAQSMQVSSFLIFSA